MKRHEAETQGAEFLDALAGQMPEDERLIMCGFVGDPNRADPTSWKPRPWRPGRDMPMDPANMNGYVTVSSFRRAGDMSFRRRAETFAAGLALMVDDVGTKVNPSVVEKVRPSAIVETSPGNFQYWYFLHTPERDRERFDGVIRAFISGKLLGADPGMSGVTRVGRIPGFLNAKAAYVTEANQRGWRVKLHELTGIDYSTGELLERFDLHINGRRVHREILRTEEALERNRSFMTMYKYLDHRAMLKKSEPDPSGWSEMTCPWVDGHTAGADTGAAIREPSEENGWYGAFRCHHGHCIDRGWSELTDWINETAAQELEDASNQGDENAPT